MRQPCYRTLLKTENVADVYKASYNADMSEMIISQNEFISLEKGKKYRILAINDDGGFDPKRASLTDYPEAAAPMFYFAKGGNSPLPAATAFKKEGSDFPNESGIVAYGMELDYTPEEDNLVKLGNGAKAEFFPLSPLLKLKISSDLRISVDPDHINSYHDSGIAAEHMKKTFPTSQSPYVLAASCLTQNFAYTVSGVDEAGAKPSFKTILKTLQAEAYDWVGSPLAGTTYEPLLIPYVGSEANGRSPQIFYLPLEPRYKKLTSRDQQETFIIPQTGQRIQGPLLADGDLYLRVYLRENDSEKAIDKSSVTTYDRQSGGFTYTFGLKTKNDKPSMRVGFNLALAKGGATRDNAEAVERFWRNSHMDHRYNLNSFEFHWMVDAGAWSEL